MREQVLPINNYIDVPLWERPFPHIVIKSLLSSLERALGGSFLFLLFDLFNLFLPFNFLVDVLAHAATLSK